MAADRASVASEFDSYLREQVSQISVIATSGREGLPLRPDVAKQAFKDIQDTGRAALVYMRSVVGSLRRRSVTATARAISAGPAPRPYYQGRRSPEDGG